MSATGQTAPRAGTPTKRMVFRALRMADIIPFLRREVFEPEVTTAMGVAFERACANLGTGNQPDVLREMIASRIIELARNGCRNADALYAQTMQSLGIEPEMLRELAAELKPPLAGEPEPC